jgi:ribosomal protein L11 methyltransferase
MFSLELESDGEAKDILIAELWESGSTGIVEEDRADGRCLLRAFFEDEAGADALLLRFPARLQRQSPRDWVAFSRAGWEPLCVGARFYLVPEWRDDPAPPGRMRIAINPGLACGTGFHEATQLCLEALEQYQLPYMTVLDVGAGSGILSIASALLGVRRVVACDVDPVAVDIARVAFQRADVRALLFSGSADAIRTNSVDLIVANISAAASIELAPQFLRCLTPGGRCIASGFETSESAAVEEAMELAGGSIERKQIKGQWSALIAVRPLSKKAPAAPADGKTVRPTGVFSSL